MGALNMRSDEEFRQERAMGFEPTTSSLGSWHSTTELRPRPVYFMVIPGSLRVTCLLGVLQGGLEIRPRSSQPTQILRTPPAESKDETQEATPLSKHPPRAPAGEFASPHPRPAV